MAKIAAQLSEKYSDNMETLFRAFNTSRELQEKLISRRPEIKILEVMIEFFSRSTNKEFEDALGMIQFYSICEISLPVTMVLY